MREALLLILRGALTVATFGGLGLLLGVLAALGAQ